MKLPVLAELPLVVEVELRERASRMEPLVPGPA
jgi:hypothetical protein